jgi:subtilisin
MAKRKPKSNSSSNSSSGKANAARASSSIEELLLAALDRGGDSLETGRYLVTFKEGVAEEGIKSFGGGGMRVASARDFSDQAVVLEDVGDADAVLFPEIGVALLSGDAAQSRGMTAMTEVASDSEVESIDPEYFVFPEEHTEAGSEYLRGFMRATETIIHDIGNGKAELLDEEEETLALGATWGLNACRVPRSVRSGAGIKVAVLDTGMDMGHPDFSGRLFAAQTASFVGQPVQDLNGHGTHCIGTACGPQSPPGTTPRYGIGYRSLIFAGKVLTNSGSGSSASVLNGMNWAIAKRCQVISMSLGSSAGPQPAYTAAGQAALNRGLLIIAAAGNAASSTGAPANSPTIMAVASLDSNLRPSSFSNFGKIEIAAPGRDVFSSFPRPTRYKTLSGTSMATPHVAGCAALWAESSASLRGMSLWRKLQATARRLPFPAAKVGAGLVQAP